MASETGDRLRSMADSSFLDKWFCDDFCERSFRSGYNYKYNIFGTDSDLFLQRNQTDIQYARRILFSSDFLLFSFSGVAEHFRSSGIGIFFLYYCRNLLFHQMEIII